MMMVRRNQVFLASLLLSIGLNLFFLEIFSIGHSSDPVREKIYADTNVPRISPLIDYYIKQNLIFVVGSMSSGTTLMRLILDTHPEINCGDETKVIELLLSFIGATYANPYYVGFMSKTGVQNSTVERAVALFIYYIMENNYKTKDIEFLKNVKYLCNKEPMNMNYYTYLHRIFPNARFLYVIRDGRDMIYSYMRRNNLPMNFNEFHKEISNWNRANAIGLSQCTQMGPSSCLMVKYESLVSDSEQTIKRITQFLGVDFVEDMLHHDDFMKTGRIIIGKEGFIRNGVQQKKINNRSVGYNIEDKIVGYDRERIAKDITLLKHLNYI